jgi:hypothetical protein
LWSLRSFVHPVIPHDLEHAEILNGLVGEKLVAEFHSGVGIRQVHKMRKNARTIDAVKSISLPWRLDRQSFGCRLGSQYEGWAPALRIIVRGKPFGPPHRRSRTSLMDHLRDPDAIVRKYPVAPYLLNAVMTGVNSPGRHGGFIQPDLIRQQQIVSCQAFETIDEQAAAHFGQSRPQRSREVQILLDLTLLRLDFEKLCNRHVRPIVKLAATSALKPCRPIGIRQPGTNVIDAACGDSAPGSYQESEGRAISPLEDSRIPIRQ